MNCKFALTFTLSVFLCGNLLAQGQIKPKRSLTKVERKQKRLLKCVENILEKGSDNIDIAQEVLLNSMSGESISNDEEIINTKISECKSIKKGISYSSEKIDTRALSSLRNTTESEKKSAQVIKMLSLAREVSCDLLRLQASVGAVIVLRAGVSKLRCLMSDGKVRNYIGPKINISSGIAATLELDKVSDQNDAYIRTNIKGAGASYSLEEDPGFTYVAGVLKANEYGEVSKNGIFLGGSAIAFHGDSVGAGVRVFNGSRRWELLLDKLK